MNLFIQLSNEDIDTALSHDLREEVRRCNKHITAMQTRIENLAEYPERLQNAITELRALITPSLSLSEQKRIAGKIDGVKIALRYFEEMTK